LGGIRGYVTRRLSSLGGVGISGYYKHVVNILDSEGKVLAFLEVEEKDRDALEKVLNEWIERYKSNN
jgi:hypothetical protein